MIASPRAVALFVALLVMATGLAYVLSQLFAPRDPLTAVPVTVSAPITGDQPSAAGRPQQPAAAEAVDPQWLSDTAAATGIPEVALRAYATAQLSDAGGCEVGWTTLAAIGWVESHHGTIGGRTLEADGYSSTPVIGPALNGKGAFAAIASTEESQAWHGDPVWDHAVGPMQFLQSSWDPWATDGDGDGVIDPLDIDDAAATTARYLCADGYDLTTGEGWSAAVYGYNHSADYVRLVHDTAETYAERAAAG